MEVNDQEHHKSNDVPEFKGKEPPWRTADGFWGDSQVATSSIP